MRTAIASGKSNSHKHHKQHLVLNPPVVLLAALAVVPVHLHSVLPHQQQVFHEGLEVQLAQDNALQLTAACRPTHSRETKKQTSERHGVDLFNVQPVHKINIDHASLSLSLFRTFQIQGAQAAVSKGFKEKISKEV